MTYGRNRRKRFGARGSGKGGRSPKVMPEPLGEVSCLRFAPETRVEEHDGTVVMAVTNTAPHRLVQRSICLLLVPFLTIDAVGQGEPPILEHNMAASLYFMVFIFA